MNYYMTAKPYDPFVDFFMGETGEKVKPVILRTLEEKNLAWQISKFLHADSDAVMVFSSDLTQKLETIPGFVDSLSNILENEHSIGIIPEINGTHLYIFPITI